MLSNNVKLYERPQSIVFITLQILTVTAPQVQILILSIRQGPEHCIVQVTDPMFQYDTDILV